MLMGSKLRFSRCLRLCVLGEGTCGPSCPVGRPLKTWSLGLSNKFPARGVPGEGPDCHVPKVIVRFKPTPTAFRRKGGQISAGYTDLCSIVREKHRADRRRK